jgi:hypothetical protein
VVDRPARRPRASPSTPDAMRSTIRAVGPAPTPRPELVVALPRAIDPAAIAVWTGRVSIELGTPGTDLVVCEVEASVPVDLRVVDALARLALTARRCQATVSVRGAPTDLQSLLDLAGLAEALPCSDATAGDAPRSMEAAPKDR